MDSGMYNQSLSPDWTILFSMIRQGEEVRVRKKCRSFVLIVEGIGITYRPLKCLCAARTNPLGTAENRRVAPATEGASSANLRTHVTRFLLDHVCVSARRGDGVGCEATLSSAPASVRDLLCLMGDNGRRGQK